MRTLLAAGGPVSPPLRLVLRYPLPRQPGLRRYQSSGPGKPSSQIHSKDGARTEEAIPVPNTVSPLPLWERLGPLTKVANAYARAQKRRPWGTQVVSALIIYCLADLSAQTMASRDEVDIDLHRTSRSLIIGGIAAIPSYTWFIFLSHHFNYASHALSLVTKIVVSQVCFAPIFNSYFFGMQAFLSGCSLSEVIDRIATTVPTSVLASCRFWPIVTAFSFTFIPIEHRSVFSGIIAIGWQTYLALLNRRAEEQAELEAAATASPIETAKGPI